MAQYLFGCAAYKETLKSCAPMSWNDNQIDFVFSGRFNNFLPRHAPSHFRENGGVFDVRSFNKSMERGLHVGQHSRSSGSEGKQIKIIEPHVLDHKKDTDGAVQKRSQGKCLIKRCPGVL